MKIVQVVPVFGMGGAEIMCENLVYELIKQGHEVVVVSLYHEKTAITQRLENAGVDIRYLDKKSGFDRSIYQKLRDLFAAEKPDVIHTHLYTTKYVFPIAKKMRIRVVHTVHSIAKKEAKWLARRLNGWFFRHCNTTPVALSDTVQQTILEEYRVRAESVPVILNGIDLSRCQPKQGYDIERVFNILHVGRFTQEKNQMMLIRAFATFHTKYPNSKLSLIGEGVMKQECEMLANQLGMSDSICFLGAQSNVHGYMHEADLFTLPSVYEGVPMTLIEAMGSALPIVATEVGGIPDMLKQSEEAILVAVDTDALAEAFEQMYLDPFLRATLGKNALRKAPEFSSEKMAKKYVEVYKEA